MDDVVKILARERRETLGRLEALTADFATVVEASQGSNADDEHDPEGATIAFERSQLDALVQQARTHLVEVDAASCRVVEGTYGACEMCGRPIGEARLDARPTSRTCIVCASR